MGKPLHESIGECTGVVSWIRRQYVFAERALEPRVLNIATDSQSEVWFEPYGVVAAVAPWNYPTSQMFLAIVQPLLAGNTVVFKHSEECSLTSQMVAKLFEEAGFPRGVFTCVYGAKEVGQRLMEQDVQLLSFTGSSRAGRMVYELAAKKFIPAVLEMGGSSPGIVFENAVLPMTCSSVSAERFGNCGQVCCALKRLFVHESVYDATIAGLLEVMSALVVGDPLNTKTTVGPLVAKRQLDVLEEQVADAVAKGATVLTGGKRPAGLEGAFYMPTLLTNVTLDMRVMQEEVFGPVLPMMAFTNEEEVVRLANDTEYGLSAFIYSADSAQAARVARQMQAGQISINGASYFTDSTPFGGYKKSGIGRTDGELGYQSFLQIKVVGRPRD